MIFWFSNEALHELKSDSMFASHFLHGPFLFKIFIDDFFLLSNRQLFSFSGSVLAAGNCFILPYLSKLTFFHAVDIVHWLWVYEAFTWSWLIRDFLRLFIIIGTTFNLNSHSSTNLRAHNPLFFYLIFAQAKLLFSGGWVASNELTRVEQYLVA